MANARKELTFAGTLRNLNVMWRMMGIPTCEEFYRTGLLAILKQNGVFLIWFVILVYTTIGEIIYLWQLFQQESSFLEVTFQAPCVGYCSICLWKMVVLAVRRNTIAGHVELFRIKWNKAIVTDEHRRLCEETMIPAIRIVTVAAIVNIVMGNSFSLLPLAEMTYHYYHTGEPQRLLPFNIWWPFDPYAGAKYFYFVYPMYFIITFSAVLIQMAFDCLFCILAAHLCLHFRILKHNISQVVMVQGKPTKPKSLSNRQRLHDAIETHQDLMGCSDFMQNVFSVALFVNFFGSSIIICIQAFMITTAKGYTLAKFLLFMLSFLMELLMLCAYGEAIVQSSGDVADATYHCLWYGQDRPFRTSILQIIHRSQRPMILVAWKFWPIRIQTFSSILQASWSYFTLLQTVYAEE
ncbi:odorant receptor 4-like [Anopheles aquasalis]|uniref:odorant receptor 4-like n=1 Tax=Anopheles aquasalis TaxID=42839 RepID=UPI00215AFC13|nr:odorant receptor 4-like [Anopheles aquasalis]